jgi:hypothetical protein
MAILNDGSRDKCCYIRRTSSLWGRVSAIGNVSMLDAALSELNLQV